MSNMSYVTYTENLTSNYLTDIFIMYDNNKKVVVEWVC